MTRREAKGSENQRKKVEQGKGGIRKMWQKIKENLKAQGFLSWCSLVVAILALLKAILFE
jgi:hypothetical protein